MEDRKSVESKVYVSSVRAKSGLILHEEEKEETIAVHKFVTEPATVSAGVGMTINTGNYENIKIDCRVTIPGYVEEIDEVEKVAFEKAISTVKSYAEDIKRGL